MTIIEVKVPQLSESVSEATILNWKKKPGEFIQEDEILAELETEKVILEVPSPSTGCIIKLFYNVGDIVKSFQTIANIDTNKIEEIKEENFIKKTYSKNRDNYISNKLNVLHPSPVASKIIEEKNIDITKISGSGKDGRVTKADVLYIKKNECINTKLQYQNENNKEFLNSYKEEEILNNHDRLENRVPMSRIRIKIAERLLESQKNSAILTTFNEVNMKYIVDLRKKYRDRFEKTHGIKLGFMSFFVKASIHALKKFPILNASIDGNDIIYHEYFDIGIAVSSPRGLVVPILRNAEKLSISDIEKEIFIFSNKAKENKLSIEDISGGTFSISNGGVFGSMMSTPIINPPQSAILGIHAMKDRPIVECDNIVIRPMNYFALSYDHRIIDGREAVLFLCSIKEILEDPINLLLNL